MNTIVKKIFNIGYVLAGLVVSASVTCGSERLISVGPRCEVEGLEISTRYCPEDVRLATTVNGNNRPVVLVFQRNNIYTAVNQTWWTWPNGKQIEIKFPNGLSIDAVKNPYGGKPEILIHSTIVRDAAKAIVLRQAIEGVRRVPGLEPYDAE